MLDHAKRILGLLMGVVLAHNASAQVIKPMVSVGYQHSVALRNDGTVLTWGSDQSGQLGAGVLPFEATPGRALTVSGIQGIAAGVTHSLAIGSDGTLWAWGSNDAGQLGDGSTNNRSNPVQVTGLTGVARVCGGSSYSVALRADGSVWAWGENSYGVLGNGTQESSPVPVQVSGLVGVSAIACGNRHALALRPDGSVWAWGTNAEGALGDGSTVDRLRPVQVSAINGVTAIAAGNDFSAVRKADGSVWEWGITAPYATPHGPPRTTPVPTPGLTGIAAIAGTVNSFGLVAIHGDGASWWRWTTASAPEAQPSVGPLKAVAAGYGQGFLLQTNGQVLGFGGGNGFGSLGDGTTVYRDAPGPVIGISNVVQLASGTWHGMALDAAGNVWTWGLDTSGQLGRARVLSRALAAVVAGLPRMAQVSAGLDHRLGVDQDGAVWAWGSNGYGELGDASYRDTGTPIKLSSISGVQAVAAAGYYSLALKRDGTVWGWGSTLPGVIDQSAVPFQLHSQAMAIAAGGSHVLALNRDGTVWAWGDNATGQLGNGSTASSKQPLPVFGLSGVIAIAAGNASSYALRSDGTVFAWGENPRGQLGDGSQTTRLTPTIVPGLNGVTALTIGANHALALRSDGSVWGWQWGYDVLGELGELGDTPPAATSSAAPLAMGIADITGITAGNGVSVVLRRDGTVYAGGLNTVGQLGDGTYSRPSTFVGVADENFAGFLHLDTTAQSLPLPTGKAVPFFLATHKSGSLSATSLKVDIRGLGGVNGTFPLGTPSVQAMGKPGAVRAQAGGGYNLYVAALLPNNGSPQYFQLLPSRSWAQLIWPISAFLSGVALNSVQDLVLITILDNDNLTADFLVGGSVLVGYGTDPDEMLRNSRYRTLFTLVR
jgi:alpha-tubulin suppressor-like RCC1 family protein